MFARVRMATLLPTKAMAYDNTNRGTLGRNDKRKSENSPEYSGKINVNGVEYWLSGWVKEGSRGRFFSLSVKAVDGQQPARKEPAAQTRDGDSAFDSDVPF